MTMQELLDKLLASHPEWAQYVSALYYIPQGGPIPSDVTQLLAISSANSVERQVVIGVAAVQPYSAYIEAILALIATMPADTPLPPIPMPKEV